ncbi:MAG: hypothetical protein HYR85_17360 [Planctomycetes bacterium]|nr:hypothetical protein [Planctomycetota bacterium]MBI3843430.1 hypothetical protein [Planctomycetota bacterium]
MSWFQRSSMGSAVIVAASLVVGSSALAAGTTAELASVNPEISARGIVIRETPVKPVDPPASFVAKFALSPSSLQKLGIDPRALSRVRVTVQSTSMDKPIAMTLVPVPAGQSPAPQWSVAVKSAQAPKVLVGDKVVVFIDGKIVVRGIAKQS